LYSPQPFSLYVQHDDGLLEAETCSWLAVTIIRYIYIYINPQATNVTYIYIYIYMEHLFLMFLDHTQRRITVGRTPLDE